MCGITGFFGSGTKEDLLRMMQTLNHRGPDDEGTYVEGALHFGYKRLSIIDLSTRGRQPMSNENDSIWMLFNGEIYNFPPLRDWLLDKGHRFKSETDSEVILHLYENFGPEAFGMLNGMFAVAIWDKPNRKLLLARDKMGQKPLYFALSEKTFVFGSEAPALLAHPCIERRLDLKSFAKYLFYEHVPTPDCIWKGLHQLQPASYLIYEPETRAIELRRYWNSTYLPRLSLPEKEYPEFLEQTLLRSIGRHLRADVPVGVYLSGGMDSTTIAYYAQRILNGSLKSFTIAFEESTFDEQTQARETARLLNTEHHEVRFTAKDFMDTTLEAIPKMEAPFADSSYIPAYYLNKFSRHHIKVALGGEGGDEVFVGYPYFTAHELLKYWRIIPASLRRCLLYPAIHAIPSSYDNETWEYRLKKFVEAEGYLNDPYYSQQIWLGAFHPVHLRKLLRKDIHEEVGLGTIFENVDVYRCLSRPKEDPMDGLMRLTQQKYLMDDGLTKADRASMAHGLEVRAPLLDEEIVEWVNRVPFHLKFRRGKTKVILRQLMAGKIPESVVGGHKRGFTPPISKWFVEDFKDEAKEVLFSNNEWFNGNYVAHLWREHLERKQNHRKLLWTLFVWNLWSSKNLSGSI